MRPDQVHPSAVLGSNVQAADGVEILQCAVVRDRAQIGARTRICSHAYIDAGVVIGQECKIKNGAMIFTGAVLGDGVFIGPGAMLINDYSPRARYRKGRPYPRTVVKDGASIGAGAVIMPGLEIGECAMIGAGAVVTKSVPANGVWAGVPAVPLMTGTEGDEGQAELDGPIEHFPGPVLMIAEGEDPKKVEARSFPPEPSPVPMPSEPKPVDDPTAGYPLRRGEDGRIKPRGT